MALSRAEISHDGLKKYRVITGKDEHVVNQKANAQKALWDEMWQRRLEMIANLLKEISDSYQRILFIGGT